MVRFDSAAGSVHPTSLIPKSGPCYDYLSDRYPTKKSVWLVPHVIKYKDDSAIITWRCNWGTSCEAKCLYAMSKEKSMTLPTDQLPIREVL